MTSRPGPVTTLKRTVPGSFAATRYPHRSIRYPATWASSSAIPGCVPARAFLPTSASAPVET